MFLQILPRSVLNISLLRSRLTKIVMGRTSSDLVYFLKKGLKLSLYPGVLEYTIPSVEAKIQLPRKSERLTKAQQKILKDWETLKGRTYKGVSSYSPAKQTLLQAVKCSVFLVKIKSKEGLIVFRFGKAEEISENRQKKRRKNITEPVLSPVKSCSSGYYSGPEEDEVEELKSYIESVASINHDHQYLSFNVSEVVSERPENAFEGSANISTQNISAVISDGNHDQMCRCFWENLQLPENFREQNQSSFSDCQKDENHQDMISFLDRNEIGLDFFNDDFKQEMYIPYVPPGFNNKGPEQVQDSWGSQPLDILLQPLLEEKEHEVNFPPNGNYSSNYGNADVNQNMEERFEACSKLKY